MRGTDIDDLCRPRGWSRTRLIRELRSAARRLGDGELPGDESLARMVRQWASGTRDVSDRYALILSEVFGFPFGDEQVADIELDETAASLRGRLDAGRQVVDDELLLLLNANLDTLRALDRRLGAEHLLAQTRGHLDQLQSLLTYSARVAARSSVAAIAAQTAALAGWQALDTGNPDDAWKLHAIAITAAAEAGDRDLLAHVTAEQSYSLLDVGRPADAAELIEHAITSLGDAGAHVLRAWLHAAHAEALAAVGDGAGCHRALEAADRELERDDGSTRHPYLFLNEIHLARWRGHCWAEIGDEQAIDDLTHALAELDPSFVRARASHHCDLAVAYTKRGETDAAMDHARTAAALALQTGSKRQRRRIQSVLKAS